MAKRKLNVKPITPTGAINDLIKQGQGTQAGSPETNKDSTPETDSDQVKSNAETQGEEKPKEASTVEINPAQDSVAMETGAVSDKKDAERPKTRKKAAIKGKRLTIEDLKDKRPGVFAGVGGNNVPLDASLHETIRQYCKDINVSIQSVTNNLLWIAMQDYRDDLKRIQQEHKKPQNVVVRDLRDMW